MHHLRSRPSRSIGTHSGNGPAVVERREVHYCSAREEKERSFANAFIRQALLHFGEVVRDERFSGKRI